MIERRIYRYEDGKRVFIRKVLVKEESFGAPPLHPPTPIRSAPPAPKADPVKRNRFLRLSHKRLAAVRRTLRILGNCRKRSVYSYEPDDWLPIFNTLEEDLSRMRSMISDVCQKRRRRRKAA